MKKFIYIFLILILTLLCVSIFVGCEDDIEDITLTVKNAKGEFVIGEEFSLGDNIVINKIDASNDDEVTTLNDSEYIVDFSSFDNTQEGTYEIIIALVDTEITYKYNVTVSYIDSAVVVSYMGGTIYSGTDINDIVLTITESNIEGTIVLDEGQILEIGTNTYEWTFVPSNIAYNQVKGSISLTVESALPTVESIEVVTPPNKLTYTAFESFDATGLEVYATYSDASVKQITDYSIEGELGSLNVGTSSVSIQYMGKYTEIAIVVNKIDAVYSGSSIVAISGVYGQKLSDLELPLDFIWEYEDIILENIGITNFDAYYIPSVLSDNYNAQAYTLSVNVERADPIYTVPTDLVGEYAEELSTITLTSNFYWDSPTALMTYDIGDKVFTISYIPTDIEHYNTINYIDVTVSIIKSNRSYDTDDIPSGLSMRYGEKLNTLNFYLATGFSWENSDTIAQDMGSQTFNAYFTYDGDTEHYNTITNIAIPVEVNKALPYSLFSVPAEMTAPYNTILSSLSLPDNFIWEDGDETVGGVNADGSPNSINAKYIPVDSVHYEEVVVPIDIVVTSIDSDISVYRRGTGTIYDNLDLYAGDSIDIEIELLFTATDVENTGIVNYDLGQTLDEDINNYNWTFTPDSINYKSCSGNIELTVEPYSLRYIGIATNPTKTTYNAFDTFDTTGMVVRAYYIDDTNEIVTNYTVNYESAETYIQGTDSYVEIYLEGRKVNCDITVSKLDLVENTDYVIPTDLTATYGQILSDILFVDSSFEWEDGTISVGNVGNNTFTATFTPDDSINYNSVDVQVILVVAKANPTYTLPLGLTSIYNMALESIELPTATNGSFAWQNPTEQFSTVGDISCYLTFTPNDTDNFNILTDIEVVVCVEKAHTTAEISYNGGDIYDCDDMSELVLTIDSSSVDGTVCLDTEQDWTIGTYDYNWIFTPTDSANYKTYTGTVSLTVIEYNISYLAYTGISASSDYVARTVFDTTGIVVTAHYNNGEEEDLTTENYSVEYIGYEDENDMLHGGDTYVTFSYKEMTVQYNIDAVTLLGTTATVFEYTDRIEIDNSIDNYASDLDLLIDTYSIDGSVAFDGSQMLEIGTYTYNWTFTPTNARDYELVIGTMELTVYNAIVLENIIVYTCNESYEEIDAVLIDDVFTFESDLDLIQLDNLYARDTTNNYYCDILQDSLDLNTTISFSANLINEGLTMSVVTISMNIGVSYLDNLEIDCGGCVDGVYTSNAKIIYDKFTYDADNLYEILNGEVAIDETYSLDTDSSNILTLSVREYFNGEYFYLNEDFVVNYDSLPVSSITIGTKNYEISDDNMNIYHYTNDIPVITVSYDTELYTLKYYDTYSVLKDFISGTSFDEDEINIYVYNDSNEEIQQISLYKYPYTFIENVGINYYDVSYEDSILEYIDREIEDDVTTFSATFNKNQIFESLEIDIEDNYTYVAKLDGIDFVSDNLIIGTNYIDLTIYDSLDAVVEIATIEIMYLKNALYSLSSGEYLEYAGSTFNDYYVLKLDEGTEMVTMFADDNYEFEILENDSYSKRLSFYNLLSGDNIFNGRLKYYDDNSGSTYYNDITLDFIVDDYDVKDYIQYFESTDENIYEQFNWTMYRYYIYAPITYSTSEVLSELTVVAADGYNVELSSYNGNILASVNMESDDSFVKSYEIEIFTVGTLDDNTGVSVMEYTNSLSYDSLSTDSENPTIISGVNELTIIEIISDNDCASLNIISDSLTDPIGDNAYMFTATGSINVTIEVISSDSSVTTTYYVTFDVSIEEASASITIGDETQEFIADIATLTVDESSDIKEAEEWTYFYGVVPLTELGSLIEGDEIEISYDLSLYYLRLEENGELYTGTGTVNATVQVIDGTYYIQILLVLNVEADVELYFVFSDTDLTEEEVSAILFS
jgi:hypothetical protein